jgi:hypothetical protein
MAASEPKRSRSDEDAPAADSTPVSRSELEDMLAQAKVSIAAESAALVKGMERTVTENFSTLIRSVDSANQKRFGGIDSELLALRQRMDDSDNANKAMRSQLGEMSKALAVAEQPQPTKKDIAADDWDKEPDHSILRINFGQGKHATKVSIERAIKPWLEESNLKAGQWELLGPASSQSFSLKFVGTQGLGGRRARSAFTNLKGDDGQYRRMVAQDLSDQEVPMYIDENKNRKQRKGETDTRRMAKILRDALPNRTVAANKKDFQVKVDHIPIVKFEPVSGSDSIVRWNNKCLADLGITDQRSAFLERFQTPRFATGNAEWDG